MSDLTELLERVKAATGPDRELDGDLFFRLDPDFPGGTVLHMSAAADPATFATGAYTSVKAPTYTTSIDAALALVVRALPGWVMCSLESAYAGFHEKLKVIGWEAHLTSGGNDVSSGGDLPTAPLAILASLLSALIAQGASS